MFIIILNCVKSGVNLNGVVINISCPRCNSEHIISAGFYVTKMYNKRYRFRCLKCNRYFVVGEKIKGVSHKQQKEIVRLSRKRNPNVSKFDNRKEGQSKYKKRTYSLREISKIMGICKETISRVLKKYKQKNAS